MEYLPPILFSLLILSLTFSYLSLSYKRTSFEIVNDMGIGYNLGNSFDCYDTSYDVKTPDDQITLCGNPIPTKEMIKNIKTNGFKTIRFPITWFNFMDESGIINQEWMSRVKEIVNWIINSKMYCIINVHHDGKSGNWLSKGIESKDKFDKLWSQISEEFKEYNEFLIFEAMNKAEFKSENNYDYKTLYNLTQSFIDIVRSSGGKNLDRLLIIPGANADFELSISEEFIIPNDPSNKFALSIHYYNPIKFTKEPVNFTDPRSKSKWGDSLDYDEIMMNFYIMKMTFPDEGIPVILSEIGVITEDQKEDKSIKEYIYAVFALAWEFDAIMPCLWDTSNKDKGDMNYFNREKKIWYDEQIPKFLKQISRGKFVSMWDFFIETHYENVSMNYDGLLVVDIKDIILTKIIFNVNFHGNIFDNFVRIYSYDKNGNEFDISYNKKNTKKQYDGSITYKIDVSDKECTNILYMQRSENANNITFNYFTFEFEDSVDYFDYISYSNSILEAINNS